MAQPQPPAKGVSPSGPDDGGAKLLASPGSVSSDGPEPGKGRKIDYNDAMAHKVRIVHQDFNIQKYPDPLLPRQPIDQSWLRPEPWSPEIEARYRAILAAAESNAPAPAAETGKPRLGSRK